MILHGDCLHKLKELPANSVDAIVTDPPYGLSFMGKHWDYDVPSVDIWKECFRVLKPGGHLLSFAGTRTQHRMAVNIEDAGFEIRDMIAWVYGSGFPKSLDVGKAIDKRGGNAGLTAQIGEAIKKARLARGMTASECDRLFCGGTTNWSWFEGRPTGQRAPTPETFALIVEAWPELAPLAEAVAEAEREVVGTAKWKTLNEAPLPGADCSAENRSFKSITAPATEAAKQWEGWGTALKPALEPITVARKPLIGTVAENVLTHGTGGINIDKCRVGTESVKSNGNAFSNSIPGVVGIPKDKTNPNISTGRFPANLIHDGSEEVVGLFPNDSARFFYAPKASKKDRDEGLEGFEGRWKRYMSEKLTEQRRDGLTQTKNHHPTVKPTDLMRYLCRLVTPKGGTVLDPFMGSGSTGKAAKLEGFNFIGIEREEEYIKIAEARINAVSNLFTHENA